MPGIYMNIIFLFKKFKKKISTGNKNFFKKICPNVSPVKASSGECYS